MNRHADTPNKNPIKNVKSPLFTLVHGHALIFMILHKLEKIKIVSLKVRSKQFTEGLRLSWRFFINKESKRWGGIFSITYDSDTFFLGLMELIYLEYPVCLGIHYSSVT